MKFYTLDYKFIEEINRIPLNFTGIIEDHAYSNLIWKAWYINSQLHRLDGPAVEYSNGQKEWWVNDKLHRLDGPAIECVNGVKRWRVYGKRITEEQCNLLHSIMKLKDLL